MELLLVLVAGAFIGFVSSFLGIGGGVIAIPTMYFLFPQMEPKTIIGTSLGMSLLVVSRNSIGYYRDGNRVHPNVFIPLIVAGFIGSLSFGLLAQYLPGETLKKILGVYLLIAAIKTFFQSSKGNDHHPIWTNLLNEGRPLRPAITGFIAGSISVLAGVGGGSILIPLFINVLKMPFKVITVYSNMTMVFTALFGVLMWLFHTPNTSPSNFEFLCKCQVGSVNFGLSLMFFMGSLVTYKLGKFLNKKTSNAAFKIIFVGTLLLLSSKILFF